jgi:hypothetical protein
MDDYRFDLRATPGQIDGPVFHARVSPPSCGRDQTCLRIDLRIVVCYEFEFCYAEFTLACINPMFPNQQTSNENEGCNCDTFHWQSYLRKRESGTANPGVERVQEQVLFLARCSFYTRRRSQKQQFRCCPTLLRFAGNELRILLMSTRMWASESASEIPTVYPISSHPSAGDFRWVHVDNNGGFESHCALDVA